MNYYDMSETPDASFRTYVNDDVRNQARKDISAALRSPECVDRWYRTLVSLKRNAELQITLDRADRSEKRVKLENHPDGRQLWLEYVQDRDRWAAGNARFKAGVEDKIDEAKEIRNRPQQRVRTLEDAINRHRGEMQDDASAADEDLWAVLQ
jgi:hypothetical protein